MKKTMAAMTLCLLAVLGSAQAQLKIDFNVTGGAVEPGYQGYFATRSTPATFTAQSYSAFGTTVSIQPTWASNAVAAAQAMIDRGTDDGMVPQDLLRDWIGTDTRQVGDPMTLTIKGLPAGAYEWVSLHHDPQDQTGTFSVTVNDASGSKTTTADVDISNGANFQLANITHFSTTLTSNGKNDITLVFHVTSPNSPVAGAFFVMNAFDLTAVETDKAVVPSPGSYATDVPRDGTILSWIPDDKATAHDVYLGTSLAEIEAATTASSAYRGRQDANSYDPGRLEFGGTYYWRVDEVLSGNSVVTGDVWSFTVEPISVPLAGGRITATASGSNSVNEGPEKTVDASGLDADGLHGTETSTMWLTALTSGPDPAWIQYQFDKVYKLHQMLVWNHNSEVESLIGFGVKNATVESSVDGTAWTALGAAQEFARAPGGTGYAADTTVDFGGIAAKYVRITIASNWGNVLKQYGLSEVRFMVVPVAADRPTPDVGETNIDPRNVLSWQTGREATRHQVFLSEDVNEVISGAALVGTVSQSEFEASELLALGKTYYWKVNEVNDLAGTTTWEGDVWTFSTATNLPVDDMEAYDDADGTGTRIYETWADGWEDNANGSQVGHDAVPFAEQTIIHGGRQSMPLYFDNSTAAYSEATRTFDGPQDWTRFGIKGLVIWFYGDPANVAGQLYVKVNGKKVAYDGDADNTLRKPWQKWYVSLSALSGVNLAKVTELTIGLEGGQGVLFIDDVGLSPNDRDLVTPAMPAATGLVARYAFEGNVNDSAGTRNGTVGGAPTYVPGKVGQAIKLDGVRDYVTVESSFELPVYTAALWFRVEGGTGDRDLLSVYDSSGGHGILVEVRANNGLRFLHRAPVGTSGGTNVYDAGTYTDGNWHHIAIVKSADAMTLYVNGVPAGSAAGTTAFGVALQRLTLGVLKHDSLSRYFPGQIDEVSLYNRVLSEAEIGGLAGRTKPYDKP